MSENAGIKILICQGTGGVSMGERDYVRAAVEATGARIVFQKLAIRPGKPGENLDAKAPQPTGMHLQVVWKTSRNAPKKPALLLLGDLIYAIEDNGVATCWEALTGNAVWSERIGGHYSASPLAAGGRIYLFSEDGKTTVLAAGREFKKLAENQLGDGFMASPAVSGEALFLRSRTQLYRLEQ